MGLGKTLLIGGAVVGVGVLLVKHSQATAGGGSAASAGPPDRKTRPASR